MHLKEHQIVPAPVMYDPMDAIGHRINEVNRKGMAPTVFIIIIIFFTLNPSSLLEMKSPLLDFQGQGRSKREN